MTGTVVAGKKLILVPILRAGLGMVDGLTQLIPSARVGHIGLVRDHETLKPAHATTSRCRRSRTRRDFFVLDPMLATGGSAVAAVHGAQGGGRAAHPLPLPRGGAGRRAACWARRTPTCRSTPRRSIASSTQNGYILPGLGDAGDRTVRHPTERVHEHQTHVPRCRRARSPARCSCSRPPARGSCSTPASSRAAAPRRASSTPSCRSIPGGIDMVVLSHAHIDHTGRLPLLVRERLPRPDLLHARHARPVRGDAARRRAHPGEGRGVPRAATARAAPTASRSTRSRDAVAVQDLMVGCRTAARCTCRKMLTARVHRRRPHPGLGHGGPALHRGGRPQRHRLLRRHRPQRPADHPRPGAAVGPDRHADHRVHLRRPRRTRAWPRPSSGWARWSAASRRAAARCSSRPSRWAARRSWSTRCTSSGAAGRSPRSRSTSTARSR